MNKKYSILGAVVLVAAIGGFLWYQNHSGNFFNKSFTLTDRANNLTPEQEKIYTDKIAKGEEQLKSIDQKQPGTEEEVADLRIYLAQQYFGLGKLQKSKELFSLVLEKDPSSQGAVEGLSLVLLAAGDKTGAALLLEKFLKDNPYSIHVWLQYVEVSTSLGKNSQELQDIYERALRGTNRHIDIITSSAVFQEKTGNIDAAISLWQEAIQKYSAMTPVYQQEIDRLKKLSK